LFGGGSLFRSLLDARLVDTVEVAVIPMLLGGGLHLLPPPARRCKLRLSSNKGYKTGILSLEYAIEYEPGADAPGAPGRSLARKGRRGTMRKAGKCRS
jgi:dihydrofolate reductase